MSRKEEELEQLKQRLFETEQELISSNDEYELEIEVDDIKDAIKEVFLEMKETGELTTWIQDIIQESMRDEKEKRILEDLKDIKMIVRRLEYK